MNPIISGVFTENFAHSVNRNCDMHQDGKSITFKTEKITNYCEGQPYSATVMTVTEQNGDEAPISHEYVLSQCTPSAEISVMAKKIASFYAREQYKETQMANNNEYHMRHEDYLY